MYRVGLASLVLLAICPAALAWVNSYDGLLKYQCQPGQHLVRMKSHHSNKHEDREWEFECRTGYVNTECTWSGYVNTYDDALNWSCPNNGIITGLESTHSNHNEDRIWKIRCCGLATKVGTSCGETGYINSMDGDMDYSVKSGEAIRGLYSYHSNHNEDRRWKVKYCEFAVCTARSMKLLTDVQPKGDKIRIVGIATGQGCSPGVTYTTTLSGTDSVTETISISDTHGKTFTFNTAISVTAEASAKFLGSGGSVSVGVTQEFGGSLEASKTTTKETSSGYSNTASQSLAYTGPGAAVIIGDVHEYKFDQTNIQVEYDIHCTDNTSHKKISTITLTATTYGQTNFLSRHGKFTSTSHCTVSTEQCIHHLRGEKALEPYKVLSDFTNCFSGAGTVYRK